MPLSLTATGTTSRGRGGGVTERLARLRPWRAYQTGALVVLAGYLVLAILLIGCGVLITHALAHSVGRWDDGVNATFARHRTTTGNRVTGDFTLLSNAPGIIGVAVVVALIAVIRRRARLAVLLVLGLVVELAGFLTATYVVARPRPTVPHLGATPSTFSWPSGHVAATSVLYGGIALIVMMVTRRLFPRILAWTVAAVLTACVALSRIYRGDHHPTDAIAGLALGIGALCVATLAVRAWATARAFGPAARPQPQIARPAKKLPGVA